MNFLNWFWQKTKKNEDTASKKHSPKDNTHLDVIISLNTDLQIDISIFINDNPSLYNIDSFDYSVLCGKFLASCFTPYMHNQLFDIIDKNVKDDTNYDLIDSIEKITTFYANEPNLSKKDKTFIKPSAVFSYHKQ